MTINVELNEASIDNAIKQIQQYKKDLTEKTYRLVDEVASKVKTNAVHELSQHIETGETITSVRIEHPNNSYTASVLAGGAAIWLEFGTGVVANYVGVGDYAHPKAAELGMSGIGTYGNGHGADIDGWWYYDEFGRKRHTFGIPATCFMYYSAMNARREIPNLARRIYRT